MKLNEDLITKETPFKPNNQTIPKRSGIPYKVGMCKCGKGVTKFEKYCQNCGQKLDWKE